MSKIFVYQLEEQNARTLSEEDVQYLYPDGRLFQPPNWILIITRTELEAHMVGKMPIRKGARKVDVVLEGSESNDVTAHIATVRIPLSVMFRRYFCGSFEEMIITTEMSRAQIV